MKEHPIPQDITSYRFHIVGNMTLKQFLEIAGGVVLAVIMFKSGLPAIIKWPFIVLFVAVGAGMAFLPIAERPLDHWILTYFYAMFKPTKFYWRKTPKIPDLFNFKPGTEVVSDLPNLDVAPLKKHRVSEYVASISAGPDEDDLESQRARSVLGYFNQAPPTVPAPTRQINVEINKATTPKNQESVEIPVIKSSEPAVVKTMPKNTSSVEVKTTEALSFTSSTDQDSKLESANPSKTNTNPQLLYDAQLEVELLPTPMATATTKKSEGEFGAGVFNTKLPFPQTPHQPNTLVGMVLNQQEEMIPGAILEIRNQTGQVERAVKSNALGQFFVTTPLKPGTYTIYVEAESFSFEPFTFITNNTILPPLEVRSVV